MVSKRIQDIRERHKKFLEEKRRGAVEVKPRVRVSPDFVSGGVSAPPTEIRRSVPPKPKTPARETKERAEAIKKIREEAGVVGKGLSEAEEQRRIRAYLGLTGKTHVGTTRLIKGDDDVEPPRDIGRVTTGRKAIIEDERLTIPLRRGELTIEKGEERAIRRKPVTIKDVEFKETFFPTELRPVAEKRRKKTGKVTLPTYVEIKAGRLSDEIMDKLKVEEYGEKFAEALPPMPSRELVFKPSIKKITAKETRVPITDLSKLAVFSPAFITATESAVGRMARGKVPAQTRVIARVRSIPKKRIKVDVIAETQLGKQKIRGISTQTLKDIDSKLTRSVSKGYLKEPKGIITEVKGVGAVKDIGIARRIKSDLPPKDIGRGVYGRTYFKETGKVKLRKGIRIGLPEREFLRVTKTPKIKGYDKRLGITEDVIIREGKPIKFKEGKLLSKQDVTAVFLRGDRTVKFIGTEKPTTRITPKKVSKIIREPEIKGEIGFGRFPEISTKVYKPRVKLELRTPVSLVPRGKKAQIPTLTSLPKVPAQTRTLGEATRIQKAVRIRLEPPTRMLPTKKLRLVEESVLIQTGKLRGSAVKTIMKDLSKPRLKASLTPAVTSLSKLKTLTIPKSKLETKPLQKFKMPSVLISKTPTATKMRLIPLTRQVSRMKQAQIPKLKLKQISIPKIKTPSIKVTRMPIIPPLLFKLPPSKRKKKKREKLIGREDLGISEGFIAKTFGFKPIKIKEKDISKFDITPIGIRRAPLIIK